MNDKKERARQLVDQVYGDYSDTGINTDLTDTEVEELRNFLESNDEEVVERASRVFAEVADSKPEDVQRALPELRPLLETDDDQIRLNALRALAGIAEVSPEDVLSELKHFEEAADSENSLIRKAATKALEALSEEYPARVDPSSINGEKNQ